MSKNTRLPSWFEYPQEFLRVVDLGLKNLDPWSILEGDALEQRYLEVSMRYPDNGYIPFAIRSDNDDIACWTKDSGNEQVKIVHDFASSGWEDVKTYGSFWDWFKAAIDDMIEHEQPYR